jgi:hypothetical protein
MENRCARDGGMQEVSQASMNFLIRSIMGAVTSIAIRDIDIVSRVIYGSWPLNAVVYCIFLCSSVPSDGEVPRLASNFTIGYGG